MNSLINTVFKSNYIHPYFFFLFFDNHEVYTCDFEKIQTHLVSIKGSTYIPVINQNNEKIFNFFNSNFFDNTNDNLCYVNFTLNTQALLIIKRLIQIAKAQFGLN